MKPVFYNFLTRKKEVFKPLTKGAVSFYACGPTVYNYVHIGNLRTYIFEDILRRTLQQAGYRVKHVMNITDVDDKIIANAGSAKKSLREYTAPYEHAFKEDIACLNILKAGSYTHATKYIPSMIQLIKKLVQKGIAYQADRSIYFDISKFPAYGALSRLAKRSLKAGARVDADEYQKDNIHDFVLWKTAKKGEPSWPASFGNGRPGWHIECSAMAMKKLGTTLDIHGGGIDLLFPHHENEIAQSEAATQKKFARFFVEGEHLLVDGHKMSKSLGNTYTLRDIKQKNFDPLDFRYLILTAHYRTKLNFTWQSLEGAMRAREELTEFIRELLRDKEAQKKKPTRDGNPYASYEKKFFATVADDLNTPKALACMWQFIRAYRKSLPAGSAGKQNTAKHPRAAYNLMLEFDNILGLRLREIKLLKIPASITTRVEKREEARKKNYWLEADRLRAEIEQKGWRIEDTSKGPIVAKQ